MTKYKFQEMVMVPAYKTIDFEIEAESLEKAKDIIREHYNKHNYDMTSHDESLISNISLEEAPKYVLCNNVCKCIDDNSEVTF